MSENGASAEPEYMELEEMPDEMLQVVVVRCFNILAQRWGREMESLVWDCYMELREEADGVEA